MRAIVGARFTTHEKKILLSDFILYDTPGGKLKAFLSARPLFDATTKHSDIHPESTRLPMPNRTSPAREPAVPAATRFEHHAYAIEHLEP